MKKENIWIVLMGLVFAFDQLTKLWVKNMIPKNTQISFLPFLSFTHHINFGAGFGLLDGWNIFLIFIAFAAIIVVAWHMPTAQIKTRNVLGAFLGGVMGNLLDRIVIGGVTDFMLFHTQFGGTVYSFPAFNVADTAITVTIFFLMFSSEK